MTHQVLLPARPGPGRGETAMARSARRAGMALSAAAGRALTAVHGGLAERGGLALRGGFVVRGARALRTACAGLVALIGLAALLGAGPAQAHKASDAYLRFTVQGEQVDARIDIALRDLDRDLSLDADGDGRLSWGEVRGRWADLQALVAEGVSLRADGRSCTGEAGSAAPALEDHSDGAHAVLQRRWRCEAAVRQLDIDYRLFATTDAQHRGIVRVDAGGGSIAGLGAGAVARAGADAVAGAGAGAGALAVVGAPAGAEASAGVGSAAGTETVTGTRSASGAAAIQAAVLGPERPVARFAIATAGPRVALGDPRIPTSDGAEPAGLSTAPPAPSSSLDHFAGFVAEGVHHILIGTDHILFLLALLLPAVLCLPAAGGPRAGAGTGRTSGTGSIGSAGWQAAPSLRASVIEVVRIVTAFTVAHSITLSLAVLDLVDPPSRWVESIIAASVVLAALNNLHPLIRGSRWGLTFAFGLVHGFGFAGALKELGLGGGSLWAPLLGFNLGVELGQLGIVAAFLPLAWLLRSTRVYQFGLLRGGSAAIAVLAAVWFAERAFEWEAPALGALLP